MAQVAKQPPQQVPSFPGQWGQGTGSKATQTRSIWQLPETSKGCQKHLDSLEHLDKDLKQNVLRPPEDNRWLMVFISVLGQSKNALEGIFIGHTRDCTRDHLIQMGAFSSLSHP